MTLVRAVSKSKECPTLLHCTNIDESDEVRPFIIGKFANPQAFQGVCNIPAIYKANKLIIDYTAAPSQR
jgi:hypothetical protein